MGCDDEKLSKYLTHTFMAHCHTMICQQVTLSGEAEWPKVADAVIEAVPEGHLFYSSGPNMRTRRIKPCAVRVCIDPILAKELLPLPTCPSQRLFPTAVMTSGTCVRVVVMGPIGTSRRIEPSTTWAISTCGVRVIL